METEKMKQASATKHGITKVDSYLKTQIRTGFGFKKLSLLLSIWISCLSHFVSIVSHETHIVRKWATICSGVLKENHWNLCYLLPVVKGWQRFCQHWLACVCLLFKQNSF